MGAGVGTGVGFGVGFGVGGSIDLVQPGRCSKSTETGAGVGCSGGGMVMPKRIDGSTDELVTTHQLADN